MIWNKLFGKKENPPKDTIKEGVKEAVKEAVVDMPTPEISKLSSVTLPLAAPEVSNEISDDIPALITISTQNDNIHQDADPLFQFDDDTNPLTPQAAPKNVKSRFVSFLNGLKKSRTNMTSTLGSIFSGGAVSIQMLDDLEDILLQADLGTEIASMLRQKLEQEKFGKDITETEIKKFLAEQIEKFLEPAQGILTLKRSAKPNVLLFVGVNGSGKTTTIGKYAKYFKQSGLNVMLAAGDTFRAAAVEQLTIWGERNDVPVYSRPQGADAAGLVYDAYAEALNNNTDILLIDTAGRLQNKHNLMQELLKIVRVLQKYDAALPHEIIMVLDATTGQNALRQAEVFRDMADISGIIMTKLDGSAKGGVLVPIGHKMKLPVYAIGIGENIEDLKLFSASDFANGLIGHTQNNE
ncbi:MAG: fused signal recognition particle receptor [Alphaproteobacteria bacterium]|jgi:fused signal recognition particle receptor